MSKLSALASLTFAVVAYSYLRKMEQIDCKCALGQDHDFLKGYCLVSMPYHLALLASDGVASAIPMYMHYAFIMATLAAFVVFVTYTMKLKKTCVCSSDARRQIMLVWPLVNLSLVGLILLMLILAVVLFVGSAYVVASSKS